METDELILNVVKLTVRIVEEKGEIHKHVKDQILGALLNYLVQIGNMRKKGQINSEGILHVQQLISFAKDKVQSLPTTELNYNVSGNEDRSRLRNHLLESLQKYQNYGVVNPDELERVSFCMEKLTANGATTPTLSKEEIDSISDLILQSFIRTSSRSSSNVIDETRRSFDSSIEKLREFDDRSIESFVKTARQKLDEINKKIGRTRRIPGHSIPHSGPANFKQVSESPELEIFYDKILTDVEGKISNLFDTSHSFDERRKKLQVAVELLSKIKEVSETTENRKTKMLNKINGIAFQDGMDYLRQLKQKVDHYKFYTEQFPYPKSLGVFYNSKREEILSLRKSLEVLKTRFCVEERKNMINHQISDVLAVLEEKACFNEKIVSSLKSLERIEKEIDSCNNKQISHYEKLDNFLGIHKKIGLIVDHHQRIISKKKKLLQKLHIIENEIYHKNFMKGITIKKLHLDEYEHDILNFLYSGTSRLYEAKKESILILKKEIENLEDYDVMDTIIENLNLVLKLLDNSAQQVKYVEKIENELKSGLKDLAQYSYYKRKMDAVPICPKKVKLLKVLENAEATIKENIFKSNINKWEKRLGELKTLKFKHPIESSFFKQKVNEIFWIKENVEDLMENNVDVGYLLEEIYQILETLDGELAYVVKNKKTSANILDSHQHFDDSDFIALNISRDSLEFLELINEKCKSLAVYVECYVGTSSSTDYDFLHGRLVHLLDELDMFNCRDRVMAEKVVETMNFVNQCITNLESNVPQEVDQ